MGLPWFRFYSETLSDKKLKLAARRSGAGLMATIGVWASLEALASESPERGRLYAAPGEPMGIDDLIDILQCPAETLEPILSEFERLHMIAWEGPVLSLVNWAKRQPDSDDSKPRVARYRAVTEPLQDRDSNGGVTPPDTDTEDVVVVDDLNVPSLLQAFGVNGAALDELASCNRQVVSDTLRYANEHGLGAGWVVTELRKRKPRGPSPPRKRGKTNGNGFRNGRCMVCGASPCRCGEMVDR